MSEEMQMLSQLISAMAESSEKMKQAYEKRDIEMFEKSKKSLLLFQNKVREMLEKDKNGS